MAEAQRCAGTSCPCPVPLARRRWTAHTLDRMTECPECGESGLVRKGRFCRACGWDADLVDDTEDEAHLDGLDLPQGYSRPEVEDEEEAGDYEHTLAQERLDGRSPVRWVVAVVALVLVVWIFVLRGR
jgi:hypothetical protein